MDVPGQPLFRPGQPLRAAELRHLQELAARAEKGGGPGTGFGAAGTQSITGDWRAAGWARITAKSDSIGIAPLHWYEWSLLYTDAAGEPQTQTAPPLAGTFNRNPAIALDGNEGVEVDTLVRLYPGDELLAAPAQGAGTRPYYFIHGGGGGTGGGGGEGTACDLVSLQAGDCLLAVSGEQEVILHGVSGTWVSTDDLTYPGGSGALEFWFENGTPHLSLAGTELLWCGTNCWSGGPLTGHVESLGSGSEGFESCAGETFTVCLECTCCSIEGWGGIGFYCIENTGPEDCVAVELLEEDRCNDSLVICSGPYATLAEALGFCDLAEEPPDIMADCSDEPIPSVLRATFHDCTGDFAALNGESMLLVWDPTVVPDGGWGGCRSDIYPGKVVHLSMCCGGSTNLVSFALYCLDECPQNVICGGDGASFTTSPFLCVKPSPILLGFPWGACGGGSTGNRAVTVTEL